jgi:hypothetical protein
MDGVEERSCELAWWNGPQSGKAAAVRRPSSDQMRIYFTRTIYINKRALLFERPLNDLLSNSKTHPQEPVQLSKQFLFEFQLPTFRIPSESQYPPPLFANPPFPISRFLFVTLTDIQGSLFPFGATCAGTVSSPICHLSHTEGWIHNC